MLRFITLFTLCLSATINAEVFDALKAPLRSHIQVEELASQFSDWAKAPAVGDLDL